ncbi:MAG TPA: hypothetical protein VJO14_08315 [Bacteroidota bacterium]|nr:hypothetical protein [Bacteroidota bacterium]
MTARAAAALIACIVFLMPAFPPKPLVRCQERYRPPDLLPAPVLPDTAASLGKDISAHIDEFATPEYYDRKKTRREFQRTGYMNMLHDILALDAVSALLSFIRIRLQIEYSLPHYTIYFRTVTGGLMPLPEDWTFPEDPWTD